MFQKIICEKCGKELKGHYQLKVGYKNLIIEPCGCSSIDFKIDKECCQDILTYKGVSCSIVYYQEDNCFCGSLYTGDNCISIVEGETIKEFLNDFKNAVIDYLLDKSNINSTGSKGKL